MNFKFTFITLFIVLVMGLSMKSYCQTATCNLSTYSKWTDGGWNTATSVIDPLKDNATGFQLKIVYSGKGFQYYTAKPIATIPGTCKKITFMAKTDMSGYGWKLAFKDKDGKNKLNSKKLEYSIKVTVNKWTKYEFVIPQTWPQPVHFTGITCHNWNHKNKKNSPILFIKDFVLETDITNVKDKDSLLKVTAETGQPRNLFFKDNTVPYKISINNWLGKTLSGTLSYKITDVKGNVLRKKKKDVTIPATYTKTISYKPKKFGIYNLSITLKLDDNKTIQKSSRFACIPKPHKLTKAEKLKSPYAINIHGGIPGVAYKSIAKLGFNWIRDYAYTYEWILKAKGNGDYAGWPWYPKMDKKIQDSGLMLLAVFSKAMHEGILDKGHLVPEKSWKFELLKFMMAFSHYPAWEVDNEYDLRHAKDEIKRNWSSYRAYHKDFGKAVKFLDESALAVEQGNAGVYPDRLKADIKSGAFDNIDVVNGHFYCGIQPPEINKRNANAHGDFTAAGAVPMLLSDNLKRYVETANIDGKMRQVWITEFGWDTLAGKIVSEREQAAYLQRCYALGLNAGIDKMFWYWNRDTRKKVPSVFFDGCGIFDQKDEPKPVAVTASTFFHILKAPKPVGTFDLGPNTMGYVFKDQDRFIALAFKIQKEFPGTKISLDCKKAMDMYGNPIKKKKVTLDITPVWLDGISENSPFYIQTAFELASNQFISGVAGQEYTLTLQVKNNRSKPISAEYKLVLPKGWTSPQKSGTINVAKGQAKRIPIKVTISPDTPDSLETVQLKISDSGTVKTLQTEFQVRPIASIMASALKEKPGKAALNITLLNNSSENETFILKPTLPTSWKAEPEQLEMKAIPGKSSRKVSFEVTWNMNWKLNESAKIAVYTKDDKKIATANIIPAGLAIPQVKSIKFDGELSDWPASSKLPAWVIGANKVGVKADIYMGYNEKGLYFAAKVNDSKAICNDPKWFWAQDTIEICIDSKNNKTQRKEYAKTDHQFWFCPIVKSNDVYLGRWKRNKEIAKTKYGIKTKGFSKKTDSGYILEAMIPSQEINGASLRKGSQIGLNLNITVQNDKGNFEFYWTQPKSDNPAVKPATWGVIKLK